jgi:lipoate-protein ligase A
MGRTAVPVRWIPPCELDGAWQMAIDEALLDAVRSGGGPVLRFYGWQGPTLSLGFHQRLIDPHWFTLVRSGTMELVRRPSGGRAVLHAGELTYALIWPDPPPRRQEAYVAACEWLRLGFAALGLPLQFGQQSSSLDRASCFATSTAADLIHPQGGKRIGSAQLWRQGALLQHGSILLEPPPALWHAVFNLAPPQLPTLPLDRAGLMGHLRDWALSAWSQAERAPGGVLVEQPLSAVELERIAERVPRYRVEESMGAATSPVLTMPRAT